MTQTISDAATRMAARRDAFLRVVSEGRALMGILNVTPDSFSDGGKFVGRDAAIAQARKLAADGADIIDVGAESTRPGHTPVAADEEIRRLAPLLDALLAEVDAPFSIDTYKAETARYAVERGVCVVNDVWGLQRDPAMADTVSETGAAVVVMHNRESVDPALDIADDMKRFFDHWYQLYHCVSAPFNVPTYMRSGARRPSNPRPLSNAWAVAATSRKRAARSAGVSALSTEQSR